MRPSPRSSARVTQKEFCALPNDLVQENKNGLATDETEPEFDLESGADVEEVPPAGTRLSRGLERKLRCLNGH